MARIRNLRKAAPRVDDELTDDVTQAQAPEFELVSDPAEEPHAISYTRTQTIEVSRDTLRGNRIVSGYSPCGFTDAYKILSSRVSQIMRGNGWNTLGVTSAGRREGKTLTAINLAISLASEFNQTALLVDADLRRPSVSQYFGLPPGPGLSDYLMSNMPLEQLLINPGVDGFVFLPAGSPLLNSTEALGWRRMAHLVEELKTRYPSRMVVFDLPPLLGIADVIAFAPCIEAALLVLEEGETSRSDVKRAAPLLTGTHLIGTVLNKSRELKFAEEDVAEGRLSRFFGRRRV